MRVVCFPVWGLHPSPSTPLCPQGHLPLGQTPSNRSAGSMPGEDILISIRTPALTPEEEVTQIPGALLLTGQGPRQASPGPHLPLEWVVVRDLTGGREP